MSPATTKARIAVIGEGKMVYDCLRTATEHNLVSPAILITKPNNAASDERLKRLCHRHSIVIIETPDPNSVEAIEALQAIVPLAIFNINGFAILRQHLLSLPTYGVINFHNGPLPLYAGLNIPTWAIWNGERFHGVTWHFVDAGIDTGDIIAQSNFSVDPKITALRLTIQCIQTGLGLFESVLDDVVEQRAARKPQTGQRTYYRGNEVPNDGFIALHWPIDRIDRLLRSLDFRPFPSPLIRPRISVDGSTVEIDKASLEQSPNKSLARTPGRITEIRKDAIRIDALDGQVLIHTVISQAGATLEAIEAAETLGLSVGQQLV